MYIKILTRFIFTFKSFACLCNNQELLDSLLDNQINTEHLNKGYLA